MKTNRNTSKKRIDLQDVGGIALLWLAAMGAMLIRYAVFL